MTNEGSEPVNACYFNIDYRLDDDEPGIPGLSPQGVR